MSGGQCFAIAFTEMCKALLELYNDVERRARKTPWWVSVWSSPILCLGRRSLYLCRAAVGWVSSHPRQYWLVPVRAATHRGAGEQIAQPTALLGDRGRFSEAIRLVLCQDIPDRHQELSRHGHNGFVTSQ